MSNGRRIATFAGVLALVFLILIVVIGGSDEDEPQPDPTGVATETATPTPDPTPTTSEPTVAPTPTPSPTVQTPTVTPTPTAAATTEGDVVAATAAFAAAYTDRDAPQWHDQVRPHVTDELGQALTYTDPANIPTGTVVDVRAADVPATGPAIILVELDTGMILLVQVDQDTNLIESVEMAP